MTTLPQTVWTQLLRHLRSAHPQLARAWFAELTAQDIERGELAVTTCNPAQARYLERHCQRAFVEAAQAVTGHLVSVRFLPDPNGAAEGADRLPELDELDIELALNPEYTFANFVTGPSNQLAHAAAVAVADAPGIAYNPLFLHGPVGMGKTHLLQAICHTIREKHIAHNCCYISCETFINHFIDAVERGALHAFRYRYRHADVLAIDDVQFLGGRERSQEEFFHTFNALFQFRRQIILTADCLPGQIAGLEERLVSRFNSGLVALLDKPSPETRMAIVRKKAKLRCYELPAEVVELVATAVDTNIRALEGALTKLDAVSQTLGQPISLALARQALGEGNQSPVPVSRILDTVAARLNLKVSELLSKRRGQAVTHPRHICMYLARRLTPCSLQEIGGYFGGRDHTTVLHAVRAISHQAESDAQLRALLDELTTAVKNAT